MRLPVIERGRELHRQLHGTAPPAVMLTEFCICGTNLAETEEEARRYQGKFVESNFHHYEFLGEHFKTVKGYDAYQQKAEIARKAGLEGAVERDSCRRPVGARPTRSCADSRHAARCWAILSLMSRFGSAARRSKYPDADWRLFAKEVLPVLKSWRPAGAEKVAA